MSTFSVITNYSTTLSSPMSSSQLTVPVNSIVTRDATPVTITNAMIGDGWYLTIDPGTNAEEIVKITGVTAGSVNAGIFTVATLGRGMAYTGATDAQGSGNAKAHNPGAIVIISDPKNLWNKLMDLQSNQTADGVKTFTQSPQVPTPTSGEVNAAASVAYVNDATTSGAPNAAVGVKGIVELGTQTQVNTGNDSGSTNATSVVIPSTFFPTWDMEVTNDYTYGDTIAAGDALYLDTATAKWKLADASVLATCDGPLGVALDAGVDTDTGKRVQVGGIVTGLVGLTPGWVYISDTAGDFAASAGTVKKVIGYAPNATTFEFLNGIAAEQLTGGSADLTTDNLNRAGTFFKTPFKQGIKTLVTAGQDLAAGDIVAIESDGSAYRTRPTGFSTENGGTNSGITAQSCSQGNVIFYDSSAPTVKTLVAQDPTVANRFQVRCIVTDGDFSAISSTTASSAVFGNTPDIWDATLFHSDKVAICGATSSSVLQAVVCSDVDGTPSFGGVISLETSANGGGISDTSVTDVLVGFGYDGSQIKSYKLTNSGNTVTESTNATFLAGSNLVPICAQRFTGTDFIAVVYTDAGSNEMFAAVGQYNPAAGTWIAVGSPVSIASTGLTLGARVMMETISSTKVAIAYQQNSVFDLSAVVLTRSGTTATLGNSLLAVSGNPGTTPCITFKQLGAASYFIGQDTTAGGKLQIIALDRDQTEFSLVGSAITNESAEDRGIAGCLLYPDRWLAVAMDSATTCQINTRQFTTNLDAAIGTMDAAVDSSATGNVTTQGYTSALTGLTAGTGYYTGLDGQPTANSYGAMPYLNNSTNTPSVRRAFVALSATEGIVKL